MMLVEETSIPSAALPIEAFKNHLRLGTGFADDAIQDPVLESFLRAALSSVEAQTGKILLQREFSWTLNQWRSESGQSLPVAPVVSVLEVGTVDKEDVLTVWPATKYKLAQDHHRPAIVPIFGNLPAIPQYGGVEVSFVAGFAAAFADLPADISQAVMMLAAYYYENRNAVGNMDKNIPYGVSVLVERYKTIRILGGGGAE